MFLEDDYAVSGFTEEDISFRFSLLTSPVAVVSHRSMQ